MTALAQAIQKVATGPHLSKDLTQEESQAAMEEVLSGQADPVQAAIFLIALRIKRETNEENLGIYQALNANTEQAQAHVEQLVVLSDPFNGFNRHCPINAFLPAVIAAAVLPAYSQGVWEMGPKFGVTHAQVLDLAGVNISQNVSQAAQQIEQIGWAYVDQAQATPKLYALQDLRTRMIKRPSLATLEKMLKPVTAMHKTHLQIGFVHKAYPDVLAWMAPQAGFASALLIRGIEGGVVPTLREAANCYQAFSGQPIACTLDPTVFGLSQQTRGVLPSGDEVTAAETLQLGLEALDGKQGAAQDTLVYGAATVLWHCGFFDSQKASAEYVRQIFVEGKAKTAFESAYS